jgi:hypothetical protein
MTSINAVYYNPYNSKRPNSSSAAAARMSQVEAAMAYIKSQNQDVKRATLPSCLESNIAKQFPNPQKSLFNAASKKANVNGTVGTVDRSDAALPLNASLPKPASARKSVRFSSELIFPQGALHVPSEPSSLPTVSVLKSSAGQDGSNDAELLFRARTAETTAGRAAAKNISGNITNYQVSGELVPAVLVNIPHARSTVSGIPLSAVPKKMTRPSLSEQLATIAANAAALTVDIRAKAGMDSTGTFGDPPLLTYPAKCFTVGTLSCRYPSPVSFYQDRMEYTFHHPFENSEIRMIMYYRDLSGPVIVGNKLRSKLPRALSHFPADFDPNNPQHQITIEFTSSGAASSVKQKIFPLMTPSLLMGTR